MMFKKTFDIVENYLIRRPVYWIFLITFVVNLPAVFFARGYGMHDDHFGPIEQPWAIINNPEIWQNRTTPHAHSIFYPLLHFLLFKFLYSFGVYDPQSVMLVVRFLHSLYSTLIPIFIFKILSLFFDQKIAFRTSLLLPFLWFMPFLSVRNLIEMVCIPPLAIGFYFLLRQKNERTDLFLAGFFFALAFAFRYQTLIISGTIFVVFLFQKRFKSAFIYAFSLMLFALLIQGSVDTFAWGYPFASFAEYVRYNLTHSGDYTSGPFYRYLLLLLGVFTFPLSIFILFLFFRNFSRHIYITLPVVIFFIFHSIFPNKQERFILPIVPFIFAFGLANFFEYLKENNVLNTKKWVLNVIWILFWAINLPLLFIFSINYGKKTRCEALYLLSKKNDVRGLYQITGKLGTFKPPEFYLNKYGTPVVEIPEIKLLQEYTKDSLAPNYAIIYGDEEVDSLTTAAERILNRKFILIATVEPSLADWILYKLNPKYNKNQVARIYFLEEK